VLNQNSREAKALKLREGREVRVKMNIDLKLLLDIIIIFGKSIHNVNSEPVTIIK